MLIEVRDPEIGDYVAPTVVPKLSATPGPSSGPAPPPGAHNDEVYAMLGLDAADLDDLAHEGVV